MKRTRRSRDLTIPDSRGRRSGTRWLVWAARRERPWIALALSGIGLLFGVFTAIHVVVMSHLLERWVNGSPQDLFLSYDSASAWIPGMLRVRGLTLRGSDPNVEWYFRMDDATISISIPDLLQKRFHATSVRAQGLVFRLREKQERSELSPAHMARLPEIPGFADPPLKVSHIRSARPEPSRRLWSIRVDNLVADPVSDIWIEIYRFRGHGRITGSFLLRPHLEARVGPATVQLLSGTLALAPDQPILSSASGRADCTIEPYDPEKISGQAVWRKISGDIGLTGRLEDLRFLNHFLRRSPQPRLEGGGGPSRVTLRFDHGIGQGRADFEVARVGAHYGVATLSGRASGRLGIPRWDVERDDMEISGSHVDLTDIVTEGTRHDERRWWGRFDIVAGRLGAGLAASTSIHCRDARPLYTLFHANLPGWAQGILKLDGLDARARVRIAGPVLEVHGLDASGGKFHVAGEYCQRSTTRSGAFLVETGPLSVGIGIDGNSSRVELLGARAWFGKASRELEDCARHETPTPTPAPSPIAPHPAQDSSPRRPLRRRRGLPSTPSSSV